jgi:hypothetical protein
MFSASGGFRIPPELSHASEKQKQEYLQNQSKIGLHEKIRVGEQRYQQRMAARKSLVDVMRVRSAERKDMIFQSAELATPTPNKGQDPFLLGLTVLLIVVGAWLVRRWRRNEISRLEA